MLSRLSIPLKLSRISAVLLALISALATITAAVAVPVQAQSGRPLAVRGASQPKPGSWTLLGTEEGLGVPTLVHVANGNDLVVWMPPEVADRYNYEDVELKPAGGMASAPKTIFASHMWSGLTFSPTLVSDNHKPLLVFEGGTNAKGEYSLGCIVGDLLTPGGWNLQTWSLSQNCAVDHLGATITGNGTLSAAWPGSGILYRIGAAPTIPAASLDQHIPTAGDTTWVAETTDNRSQQIYATWAEFFSRPASKDGLWAADLGTEASPIKAPDTGSNTTNNFSEQVAVASPAVRGGAYSPTVTMPHPVAGSSYGGTAPRTRRPFPDRRA